MTQEIEQTQAETAETLAIAKSFVIATDDDNILASDLLRGIKTLQKDIEEHFRPNIKRWHDGHKAAMAELKTNTTPLEEAEKILKAKIGAYMHEQERIREIEQRRLAEAARIEEESRRLSEAAMLEAQGETEAAEEVLQEACIAPPPLVFVSKQVAPAGISTREVWTYTVSNEALIPRSFMVIDHAKIGKVVTAMKGATNIPGIQAYSQKQVAAKGW